ncbi:hypothetical protein LCGC14_2419520 [marine sediment metagenome]|uniref:Uncharacterized protein n=1 Tax=marine sediment metagenome TaxID=412755 RepID=A0A0F9BQ37_9ZZZZ
MSSLIHDRVVISHTPGPWTVSGIRHKIGGEPVLSIYAPNGKTYVYVLYGNGSRKQHTTAYADARLIAAAPELLDVLRDALEPFNIPTRNPSGNPVGEPEWCNKARAVITKAI